jgi:ABC-type amino acid transport substrate-binding protein
MFQSPTRSATCSLFLFFLFLSCESIVLKTVVINQEPFTRTNISGQLSLGFTIDLTVELTKLLNNITFENYLVEDGNFGSNINGTWNGVIGDLISKKADVAIVPLTYNSERAQVVKFTTPFLNVGLKVLALKVEKSPQLISFLLPFHWTVWISVVGVVVLVAILLWIYDFFSPYGLSKIQNSELNLTNSFLNSGIGMTGQLGNPGRSWATRILTLGYYLFLIIVTSSYTANLTNVLTGSTTESPITSYKDITNGYITGTVQNSAVSSYLSLNPTFSSIKPFMRYYPNYQTLLAALRKGEIDLLIWDSTIVKNSAESAPCDLQEIGEVFGASNYAIATQKNMDSINDQISKAILTLKENGFLDSLTVKWLTASQCSSASEVTSIGFDTFGGVFIGFGFLLTFCTLVIVAEIVFNFIYKSFGDKFPFLFYVHRFFGGERYTHKEESKDIKINNTNAGLGSGVELSFNCL